MLTIELEDDLDKMNCFIRELKLVHYAMTLGGYRTTMSYPPFSSHDNLTREERYAIGITDGMIRVSIGKRMELSYTANSENDCWADR